MKPLQLAESIMQNKTLLIVGLGFAALMACTGTSQADGRRVTITVEPTTSEHKAAHSRKRATRVHRYVVMRGGYSYGKYDVIGTYGSSRAPYAWVDQSPGGPFDSGFFFDSGVRPLNNAPYPR
jgi:hypothetical protein